ncbi:UNVERIFIED_CONTAM: Retrovirus-related Pol polyprotein from transposon TNT 1-94 [Sesamum calycinum]|uniref:Retrovirus-related Pol polyprotein from transposon TNT 1-94 n=1 Tax=Sesamum calycinum TaxID=2727403 RepID=A0AAW2J9Q1_9LAMI
MVAYIVLYVDDILLIGNDFKMLGQIRAWLSTQVSMKDMGEASYIFGIKIYRDRSRRMLGLTQSSYIEKVLKRFKMENSKRGFLPMMHEIKLSKKQSPRLMRSLRGGRTSPMLQSWEVFNKLSSVPCSISRTL